MARHVPRIKAAAGEEVLLERVHLGKHGIEKFYACCNTQTSQL